MNILRVLNISPLFHVSCDENFGTLNPDGTRRYSLLATNWGTSKLYFLTFRKNDKFKLLHITTFSTICPPVDQIQVNEKTESYATAIQNQAVDALNIQLDFLKESYASNITSEASMDSRVSSYVAAYLVLIGFFAYLFHEIWSVHTSPIFWPNFIIFLVGILFLYSSGAFIWQFLRVRNSVRSTFRELRSDSTLHKRVELAYINWYASKEELRRLASHVKNIEHNLAASLSIAILVWLTFFYFSNAAPLKQFAQPNAAHPQQAEGTDVDLDALLHSLEAIRKENTHPNRYILGTEAAKPQRKAIADLLRLYVAPDQIIEITVDAPALPNGKRTLILREE